mgnify:CR=1 FL=1|jgi:hypothetical protein|tara:strand:- start:2179 stop:2403 length:225 start_codon:yes stop_codon:yes gene_type:complete
MIREKQPVTELVIDLTGPNGNAFSLMANAKTLGRQLGLSQLAIDGIIEEMKLSDYEHLIQTFDKHFGSFCVLER